MKIFEAGRRKKIIGGLLVLLCGWGAQCCFGAGLKIVGQRGEGLVHLVKYDNGGWQLIAGGKPYFVKGLEYSPVKIGNKLTDSNRWMYYDFNENKINDTAYESWVDANNNNLRDPQEKAVGDFRLMKEMGANTIRIYHPFVQDVNKELMRDLHKRYGIRVIMGNFFGAYCWGSQAEWGKGTDYSDPGQRKNMLEDIKRMVIEHKDEPYLLMWMLGNENDAVGSYDNSTFNNTNARQYPEEYVKLVNEAAKLIHSLDGNHPVGVCNAHYIMLPYYAKYAPEIDILAFNSYVGPYGFDAVFRTVKFFEIDRPVLITEYGCDSWDSNKQCEDQDFQVFYHKGAWGSLVKNSAAYGGISIGGVIFNWLDSWWHCGSPTRHDTDKGRWQGPVKDGWMNDEWLGVCAQGDGSDSPFMRQPKKVYYFYKQEWNKSDARK